MILTIYSDYFPKQLQLVFVVETPSVIFDTRINFLSYIHKICAYRLHCVPSSEGLKVLCDIRQMKETDVLEDGNVDMFIFI